MLRFTNEQMPFVIVGMLNILMVGIVVGTGIENDEIREKLHYITYFGMIVFSSILWLMT